MKPILALAFFAATALIAPGARADDSTSPAPTAAVADAATPSLSGVKCVLRAANGQTQFRQGETISLVASFTSDRPGYKINMFVRDDRGMATLGAVKVSPSENVTDPIGELPPPTFLSVMGNIPSPMTLSEKPVEFPFVLNDWARFDKPGVYQVTLSTARVFMAKSADKRDGLSFIFNSSSSSPITSEPLQIEITPADENWSNQQVEITREFWRKQGNAPSYPGIERPENDISFLGTRAAMTAIIEHLGQNTQPRSSGDDTYLFHTGFIGFADRPWLISEMKRAIEQPNYTVTQGFFQLLTELQSLQNTPRPAGADASFVGSKKDAEGQYVKDAKGQYIPATPTPAQQLQIDWQKRRADAAGAAWLLDWQQTAEAVDWKTGATRALTLHSLLELAWNGNRQNEPPIKAELPKLIAQLAPVFDQLPPLPRLYLLGQEWENIKSPAFAPALARLWKTTVATDDYYAKENADLTLQRLVELDPKRNRALVVEQIKAAKPRVSIKALGILPDATLPALDDVLAAKFENPRDENRTLSALLVERYASAAILPRIKTEFENSSDRLGNDMNATLLAYFVRVNPGYGIAKLKQKLNETRKWQDNDLLSGVASLQFNPQIEALAINNLSNAGEGAAKDAARTLARFGSPAAQSALINRLQNTGDAKYPQARGRIEYQLVEALANARNWLCSPAQLEQIRKLCLTDDGRRTADEYLRARAESATNGKPFWISYTTGPDERWGVERYSGLGLENLRAKLAQFPRGSAFTWQKVNSGPGADQVFEATKQWATQRGLKIEAYVPPARFLFE